MSDSVFLYLFKPFPLCQDFNRSPRDSAPDLKFSETFFFQLPEPHSCSAEDVKFAAAGIIYFEIQNETA